MSHPPHKNNIHVGLLRRMAALFYDSLLVFSVLFAATLALLPFTQGAAIGSQNWGYQLYLLIASYLYFTWQWTHGGQTLGMRAWRIKLVGTQGSQVTWGKAGLRFILAIPSGLLLGIGFLWSLWDGEGLALHDRYSKTYLVHIQS